MGGVGIVGRSVFEQVEKTNPNLAFLDIVKRTLPFVRGRYWVTLGVHSKDASRVYHVQEQRYSFEVKTGAENPGQVFIPVDVDVEEL